MKILGYETLLLDPGMKILWRYKFKIRILGREVAFQQRTSGPPFGRFGGGWNWELGFQIGSGSVIVNYLVGSMMISRKKKGGDEA